MTTIISESPNGKQRIVIDPSLETVTFINCMPAPATSFFSMPRAYPEFVCSFEEILDANELRRGANSSWTPPRMRLKQVVTAHGYAWYRGNWTNSDETWDMLQAISKTTPDAPMLTDVNNMPLLISGLAIIAVMLMFIYFWLTGN